MLSSAILCAPTNSPDIVAMKATGGHTVTRRRMFPELDSHRVIGELSSSDELANAFLDTPWLDSPSTKIFCSAGNTSVTRSLGSSCMASTIHNMASPDRHTSTHRSFGRHATPFPLFKPSTIGQWGTWKCIYGKETA